MWRWRGDAKEKAGIPGVPARDLSDEEFDHYAEVIDARFPDQPGSLKRSGLYEHVPERRRNEEVTKDGD